jgi:hypothetical protein
MDKKTGSPQTAGSCDEPSPHCQTCQDNYLHLDTSAYLEQLSIQFIEAFSSRFQNCEHILSHIDSKLKSSFDYFGPTNSLEEHISLCLEVIKHTPSLKPRVVNASAAVEDRRVRTSPRDSGLLWISPRQWLTCSSLLRLRAARKCTCSWRLPERLRFG